MIVGDISEILVPILTIVDVLVMAVLCLVIMLQKPKQEGLGAAFGSSMTDQVFGARTTDVLEKATRNLGILFIIITIGLGIVVNRSLGSSSLVVEPVAVPTTEAAEVTNTDTDVEPETASVTEDATAEVEGEPSEVSTPVEATEE